MSKLLGRCDISRLPLAQRIVQTEMGTPLKLPQRKIGKLCIVRGKHPIRRQAAFSVELGIQFGLTDYSSIVFRKESYHDVP